MQKRMKAEIEARTTEVTSLREKLQQYVGLSDSAEDAMAADGQPMAALFGSAAVRAAREAEVRD